MSLTCYLSFPAIFTEDVRSAPTQDPELIALVQRAQDEDLDAQSQLIERFKRPIGRYVYTLILERSAVEDVTQVVFIKMLRALPGLRRPETFRSWLYSLARHSSFDHLRRQRFTRFLTRLTHAELATVPDERSEDASLRFAETFERALRDFSCRDRELLALALQGHSYEEIARLQGASHGSVKGRLCRVREHLRAEMIKADAIRTHAT
jgi:RNA polymerase sigma-70 factor, ECF subfamily